MATATCTFMSMCVMRHNPRFLEHAKQTTPGPDHSTNDKRVNATPKVVTDVGRCNACPAETNPSCWSAGPASRGSERLQQAFATCAKIDLRFGVVNKMMNAA